MSRVEDDVLYHFVGFGTPDSDEHNFRILCAILESERVGREGMSPMQITIDPTREPVKGELIEQAITCYCDISFDNLKLHVQKYGAFGVGVDRRELCRSGARSVYYIPMPNPSNRGSGGLHTYTDLRALLKGVVNHVGERHGTRTSDRVVGGELHSAEEVHERLEDVFLKDLLAFVKFYDSELRVDDDKHFYAEREWRKFGAMSLTQSLREIVAPEAYVDRLKNRFPHFAGLVRPYIEDA
jgi:hypothetical protein